MQLNADFSQRVVVHSDELEWVESPMAGVSRRMLDRMGDEVARATSIVKYAPNSHFSPHVHTGGEEFIVLEGVFQDEHGDFPAGSYIRNPPQSSHTPGSDDGCIIFVKLWQFDLHDRQHVRLRLEQLQKTPQDRHPGIEVAYLYHDDKERVRMETWSANATAEVEAKDGAEIFVLQGSVSEAGETLGQNSWLRSPIGRKVQLTAGADGASIWIKSGHLPYAKAPEI